MYDIALWLHVTGAALLFVAIGAEVFAGMRLRQAGDVGELRAVARISHSTGPVHGIASLLLLVMGASAFAIVYLMTNKPDAVVSWIVLAAAFAFGALGGRMVAARSAQALAAA